jgi:PAS domain S-box-containing protein/putative nucleotidyltransferase with HDIG domain
MPPGSIETIMNSEETLYLAPYLLSLALSSGIFLYTLRHRHVRGARVYTWFVFGQTLTILGFIFELITPTLEIKIIWDKFQWMTDAFLVILPFLIFAIQFSEYKPRRPMLLWGALGIVALAFTIIILTDNIHHLVYSNPQLSSDYPFPDLKYDFTYVVYIFTILYVYWANVYGISLLLRRAFQPYNIHRLQYFIIALGFAIPTVLSVLSLANIQITPQRDNAPFALAIGNLIVAYGLFRFRIFDIGPIARDTIFENISDPLMVVDLQDRIVDINPAALAILGIKTPVVVGYPLGKAFLAWPHVVDKLLNGNAARTEISMTVGDATRYYEVIVSPLYGQRKERIGRAFIFRDNTEHKEMDEEVQRLNEGLERRVNERTEELRESAERYRSLFEQTNDAIFILDLHGHHVDVNQRAADMLGYTHEEIIGISVQETSNQIDESEGVRERLLRGEHIPVYERVFRRKNGELIPVEINVELVRDQNGNPLHIQSAVRDISHRKQTEEALRHSEEQYRAVVENQTEFIVRWRPDRKRTFVNKAYCHHFGLTLEEALQVDFLSHIAEEDRTRVEEKIARLLSGVADVETEVHQVIESDGSIGWQEWTDHAIRDRAGKVVEFQSIGRDITERKLAEDKIRKLSRAVEQSNASIVITDTTGAIEYVNPFFSELTGYSLEEATGKNPNILQSGITPRKVYKDLWATVKEGKEWRGEFCNRKKNGELYWESAYISPIVDRSGDITHFVAVKTDITERKRAETALQKSEMKHRLLFESANDSIFIMKGDRFIDCNSKTLEMFACGWEDIIGKRPQDFSPEYQPDGVPSQEKAIGKISAVMAGNPQFFEWKHCRADKMPFDAEVSLNLLNLDDGVHIQAIVRDITERKRAETRILHLNRLYVTISQINQAIVHTRYKDKLFSEICRIAIDHGEFRMAWIGLIDDTTDLIIPFAFAGEETNYLAHTTINLKDNIFGQGPTGTAIHEGHCVICQDIESDPRMLPWQTEALKRGYRSSATVPFREQGKVVGSLNVYAGESHGFDADDEELLEQIGQDISFALDSMKAESERKRAEENLAEAYDTTLEGWAKALELRDKETEGHSRRVTETTLIVARAMGFDEEALTHVRRGCILHDIGKMGIPDDILRKEGPLTKEERAIVEKHPTTAYELIVRIPYLEKSLDIPYTHHEKWDGTGYPRGLKGEEIPLAARIFAIVDVWDALSSDRPYRNAWGTEKVKKYLQDQSGKYFDPMVVGVFLRLVEEDRI